MAPIGRFVTEGAILRLIRRSPADGAPISRSGRFPVWRWVILLVTGIYFLVPLYAAIRFAGLHAFGTVFSQEGFGPSLWVSVQLGIMTWLITLVLMVPTTIYVHLRLPALRRVLEGITILPIVIPPVVLIIGVLQIAPLSLKATQWLLGLEYVILAMPFAYRAIDAGLRSIDLKTLTEASSSLGAGWLTTLWRVILPNLRTSLLSASVLIVALVLGEYTMASLNLVQTFPVWIVLFDQQNAQISVAASMLSLIVTWLFLMLIVLVGSRQARRTGRGEVNLFSVTTTTTTIGES
jgi:putative spermidine/putrescine transport system permease protein